MTTFFGSPFIDVRIDFNSWLPININNDTAKKIEAQGGMRKEYEELIEWFISMEGFNVIRETPTSVTLTGQTTLFYHRVLLVQMQERCSIRWSVKNTWGDFHKDWTFESYESQVEMAVKMSGEIAQLCNDLVDEKL